MYWYKWLLLYMPLIAAMNWERIIDILIRWNPFV